MEENFQLKGLKNLKNTCFINSIVQCLIHIDCLRDCIHKLPGHERNSNSSQSSTKMLFDFKALISFYYFEKKLIIPTDFVSTAYSLFINIQPFTQQDAQEFLYLFLDKLNTNLLELYPEKTTIINQCFLGNKTTTYTCFTYNINNTSDENFIQLELPVPSDISINSNLQEISEERYLIEKIENSFFRKLKSCFQSKEISTLYDCLEINFASQKMGKCLYCGKENNCEVQEKITRLPKFLIISLKRFKFLKSCTKICDQVYTPRKLNMKKYCQEEITDYTLLSIIQHKGGLKRGHYTAFIMSHEK